MNKIFKTAFISLLCFSVLMFYGCGGGGGAEPGASSAPSQSVGEQPAVQPSASVAGLLQGRITFPTSAQTSLLKSVNTVHFARQQVDLQTGSQMPLRDMKMAVWAMKKNENGYEEKVRRLGEGVTNVNGDYTVSVLKSDLQSIGFSTMEELYSSPDYRLRLELKRERSSTATAIDRHIYIRPQRNGEAIGQTAAAGKKNNLTIDVIIDFADNQSLRVDVRNTEDIVEFQKNPQLPPPPRLVVMENIDINYNGISDEENPLVLYQQSHRTSVGDVVSIYEIDADADGSFATNNDLVHPQLLNPSAEESDDEIAGFVDMEGDAKPSDKTVVQQLDNTPPQIRFISPSPDADGEIIITDRKTVFEVEFSDDYASDISTFRTTSAGSILFVSPVRYRLSAGADFGQQYFTKSSSRSVSGRMVQTASFTLDNPVLALGIGNKSWTFSISDFAGNKTQATISFMVDGSPQFKVAQNSWSIADSMATTYIDFLIEDVPPVSIGLGLGINTITIPESQHGYYELSGGQRVVGANEYLRNAFDWISLSLIDANNYEYSAACVNATTLTQNSADCSSLSSPVTFLGEVSPKPDAERNTYRIRLSGVPGYNFASALNVLPQSRRVLQLFIKDKDGNQVSEWINLLPSAVSTAPMVDKICRIKSRTLSAVDRMWLCTMPLTTGSFSNDDVECKSAALSQTTTFGQNEVYEKQLQRFMFCGTDVDEEDALRFSIMSHDRQYGTDTENTLPLNRNGTRSTVTDGLYKYFPQTDEIRQANVITDKGYRYGSTISFFEWTPASEDQGDHYFTFQANDSLSTAAALSVTFAFKLRVEINEDPPRIYRVSHTGTRAYYPVETNTNYFVYGHLRTPGDFPSKIDYPDTKAEESAKLLEDYLHPDSNEGIQPSTIPLFMVQQGRSATFNFLGWDDEIGTADIYVREGGTIASLIGKLGASPDWLAAQQEISPYDRPFSGVPLNSHSLTTAVLNLSMRDPGTELGALGHEKYAAVNLLPVNYQIPIKILDLNDAPQFFNSTATNQELTAAFSNAADVSLFNRGVGVTPAGASGIVTAATEDQQLTFYVHAYDIDPCLDPDYLAATGLIPNENCPYFNPDRFEFKINMSCDGCDINDGDIAHRPRGRVLNYNYPSVFRTYEITWVPSTWHTWEQDPTKPITDDVRRNTFEIEVSSPCAPEFFNGSVRTNYLQNCSLSGSAPVVHRIKVHVDVKAVDEAPGFDLLTVDYADLSRERLEIAAESPIIELWQNDSVNIKQFAFEEEGPKGQSIQTITRQSLDGKNSRLSFLTASLLRDNPQNIYGKYLELTGTPSQEAITYVLDPTGRMVPDTLSMTLRATSLDASGNPLTKDKVLRFWVYDVADPPVVHAVPAQAFHEISENYYEIWENELFEMSFSAANPSEQDPEFKKNFWFYVDSGVREAEILYPHLEQSKPLDWRAYLDSAPVDEGSTEAALKTTAFFRWTPQKKDVDGLNPKLHDFKIKSCVAYTFAHGESYNQPVCRDHDFQILVKAINNPPIIRFGDFALSTTVPTTFTLYENDNFERMITVSDPEQQLMNARLDLKLLDSSFSLPTTGSVVGPLSGSGFCATAGGAFDSIACGYRLTTHELFRKDGFSVETLEPLTNALSSPGLTNTTISRNFLWSSIDWDDISTTPTGLTSALYALNIRATDLNTEVTGRVHLRLLARNDPPRLTDSVVTFGQTSAPGTAFDLSGITFDEEGDTLSFAVLDRGNTAINFISSTLLGGTSMTLSATPGDINVGDHNVQIRVSDGATEIMTFITVRILDTNDAPAWDFSAVLSGQHDVNLASWHGPYNMRILDPDLLSAPGSEHITYALRVSVWDSQDPLQSAWRSLPVSVSVTSFTAVTVVSGDGTEHNYQLRFNSVSQKSLLHPQGHDFTFSFYPDEVFGTDPFLRTTMHLELTATDQFQSEYSSVTATAKFRIIPVDHSPSFYSVNGLENFVSTAVPGNTVYTVCRTKACTEINLNTQNWSEFSPLVFSEGGSYELTMVAKDREEERIKFDFTELWTKTTTTAIPLGMQAPTPVSTRSGNPVTVVFQPENRNAGIHLFSIQISDEEDPDPNSVNQKQTATATFVSFVQNTAQTSTFEGFSLYETAAMTMNPSLDSMDLVTMVTTSDFASGIVSLVLKEDNISYITIKVDDEDRYIYNNDPAVPNRFNQLERRLLLGSIGVEDGSTAAQAGVSLFENNLIPTEEFTYELVNIHSSAMKYPNMFITNPSVTTDHPNFILFAFGETSNVVNRTTTNIAALGWQPGDLDTHPKIGPQGEVPFPPDLRLIVKSYASGIKTTSVTLSLMVTPVNDAPEITEMDSMFPMNPMSSPREVYTAQNDDFSFTLKGEDEEESVLSFHFAETHYLPSLTGLFETTTTLPGDMTLNGNKVVWSPTNDDTRYPYYDIGFYAMDTGKVSSIDGLSSTTPLSSQIRYLRIHLQDVDDPATYDSDNSKMPTTALRFSAYTAKLVYKDLDNLSYDPDLRDTVFYYVDSAPEGFLINEENGTIEWAKPDPSGRHDIRIKVVSKRGEIERASLFRNYSIEVEHVNAAPKFTSKPETDLIENKQYTYSIVVDDADEDTIFLKKLGSGSEINTVNPAFVCSDWPSYLTLSGSESKMVGLTNLSDLSSFERGVAPGDFVTSYNICLEATDGQDFTTQYFTLKVLPENNLPTITALVVTTAPDNLEYFAQKSWTNHLVTSEPLVYRSPQNRKVKIKESVSNTVILTFYDEEGDFIGNEWNFQMISGPTGATFTQAVNGTNGWAPSGVTSQYATWKIHWSPDDEHISTPPSFTIRARDGRGKETDFIFHTEVINTPEKPVVRFKQTQVYVNEDSWHTLSLDAYDNDPGSVLSFSIVTDSANFHPGPQPIYLHNPLGRDYLSLQIDTLGEVRFRATRSSSPEVPVTFSVCGAARVADSSVNASDCVTVSYKYLIQNYNDDPYFSPSIPPSLLTTAKEGNTWYGPFFRRLTYDERSEKCENDDFVHIICLLDEESETDPQLPVVSPQLSGVVSVENLLAEKADFPYFSSEVGELFIKTPELLPTGLGLSSMERMCLPTYVAYLSWSPAERSTRPVQCLTAIPAYACKTVSGCEATTLVTGVQQIIWENVGYDAPRVLNLLLEAKERADSTKNADFVFSLNVEDVNRAPEFSTLVSMQIDEGTELSYDLSAKSSDPDNDELRYEIVRGVSGMTVTSNTGLVKWTPNVSHIGHHLIQFRVKDVPGVGSTSLTSTANLTISVRPKNNPPVIEAGLRNINDISRVRSSVATQDALFEAKIFAWDEEGDSFSFYPSLSKLNGKALPEGFLSSAGIISWVPGNSYVGPNTLLVYVKDTKSTVYTSREFTINVNNVNDAPVLTNKISTGQHLVINIYEGDTYTHEYTISDPDVGDTHTYTLTHSYDSGDGTGAKMISNRFEFVAPGNGESGVHSFSVTAKDSGGLTDTNTFKITVNVKNTAPVLEEIPELMARRGEMYSYSLYAEDAENDDIEYSLVSKPTRWELDKLSGVLTVQPPSDPASPDYIEQSALVYAIDSNGNKSAEQSITVRYTDRAVPKIISEPKREAKILSDYSYTPATDIVLPAYSIEYQTRPDGMSGNTAIEWTPPLAKGGKVEKVVFRIRTNMEGVDLLSNPQRYWLAVSDENELPVLEHVKSLETGQPVTSYDATQDIAFSAVVATLTEYDAEDSGRLDIFFVDTDGAKKTTANSYSKTEAEIELGTTENDNGKLSAEITLKWQPDNGAAFAETKGERNVFRIQATDGIGYSEIIEVTFRVTNVNDLPEMYEDENRSFSETAYGGEKYTRDFFARDLDDQVTYFCLQDQIGKGESDPKKLYPGYSDRFRLLGTKTATQADESYYCVLGTVIPSAQDPSPERGKLSRVTLEWSPVDADIAIPTYSDLGLTVWDNEDKTNYDDTFKFTLKLAPQIRNLVPPAQFKGWEVEISGDGIVETQNQLSVIFYRSDGTISATTEVYDIKNLKGKFIVPEGAVSGSLAIGFDALSRPYPFTVLNAVTETVAGNTGQEIFSAPAGMVVTDVSVAGVSKTWAFVSDKNRHTVEAWIIDPDDAEKSELQKRWGNPYYYGDQTGENPRFNFPTGLSFAFHQGWLSGENKLDDSYAWIIVADTDNNKIKAIDITDFYREEDDDLRTNVFPVYTIGHSYHLQKPYHAIQSTEQAHHFLIANTFNNTIELLSTKAPGQATSAFQDLMHPDDVIQNVFDGTTNTRTLFGSGASRVDQYNVFHPVSLSMTNPPNPVLYVASYTNFNYSYNNSSLLFVNPLGDRNDNYKGGKFSPTSLALGNFAPTDIYDAELLYGSFSSEDMWSEADSPFSYLGGGTGDDVTETGRFYSTSQMLFSSRPSRAATAQLAVLKAADMAKITTYSLRDMLYQTPELVHASTVGQSAYMETVNQDTTISRALVHTSLREGQASITPIREGNYYSISGLMSTTLPEPYTNEEMGSPFYYDTNQDGIDDLWIPFPERGEVVIFPGMTSTQSNDAPLSFDIENYWWFDSQSISDDCGTNNCLVGVSALMAGRFNSIVEETATTPVLSGDDLIILNPERQEIIVIDSYRWTYPEVIYDDLEPDIAHYNSLLVEEENLTTQMNDKRDAYLNLVSDLDEQQENFRSGTIELAFFDLSTPEQYPDRENSVDIVYTAWDGYDPSWQSAGKTYICSATEPIHHPRATLGTDSLAWDIEFCRLFYDYRIKEAELAVLTGTTIPQKSQEIKDFVTAQGRWLVSGWSVSGLEDLRFHVNHRNMTGDVSYIVPPINPAFVEILGSNIETVSGYPRSGTTGNIYIYNDGNEDKYYKWEGSELNFAEVAAPAILPPLTSTGEDNKLYYDNSNPENPEYYLWEGEYEEFPGERISRRSVSPSTGVTGYLYIDTSKSDDEDGRYKYWNGLAYVNYDRGDITYHSDPYSRMANPNPDYLYIDDTDSEQRRYMKWEETYVRRSKRRVVMLEDSPVGIGSEDTLYINTDAAINTIQDVIDHSSDFFYWSEAQMKYNTVALVYPLSLPTTGDINTFYRDSYGPLNPQTWTYSGGSYEELTSAASYPAAPDTTGTNVIYTDGSTNYYWDGASYVQSTVTSYIFPTAGNSVFLYVDEQNYLASKAPASPLTYYVWERGEESGYSQPTVTSTVGGLVGTGTPGYIYFDKSENKHYHWDENESKFFESTEHLYWDGGAQAFGRSNPYASLHSNTNVTSVYLQVPAPVNPESLSFSEPTTVLIWDGAKFVEYDGDEYPAEFQGARLNGEFPDTGDPATLYIDNIADGKTSTHYYAWTSTFIDLNTLEYSFWEDKYVELNSSGTPMSGSFLTTRTLYYAEEYDYSAAGPAAYRYYRWNEQEKSFDRFTSTAALPAPDTVGNSYTLYTADSSSVAPAVIRSFWASDLLAYIPFESSTVLFPDYQESTATFKKLDRLVRRSAAAPDPGVIGAVYVDTRYYPDRYFYNSNGSQAEFNQIPPQEEGDEPIRVKRNDFTDIGYHNNLYLDDSDILNWKYSLWEEGTSYREQRHSKHDTDLRVSRYENIRHLTKTGGSIPATPGETGVIYIRTVTGEHYYWDGSTHQIFSSAAQNLFVFPYQGSFPETGRTTWLYVDDYDSENRQYYFWREDRSRVVESEGSSVTGTSDWLYIETLGEEEDYYRWLDDDFEKLTESLYSTRPAQGSTKAVYIDYTQSPPKFYRWKRSFVNISERERVETVSEKPGEGRTGALYLDSTGAPDYYRWDDVDSGNPLTPATYFQLSACSGTSPDFCLPTGSDPSSEWTSVYIDTSVNPRKYYYWGEKSDPENVSVPKLAETTHFWPSVPGGQYLTFHSDLYYFYEVERLDMSERDFSPMDSCMGNLSWSYLAQTSSAGEISPSVVAPFTNDKDKYETPKTIPSWTQLSPYIYHMQQLGLRSRDGKVSVLDNRNVMTDIADKSSSRLYCGQPYPRSPMSESSHMRDSTGKSGVQSPTLYKFDSLIYVNDSNRFVMWDIEDAYDTDHASVAKQYTKASYPNNLYDSAGGELPPVSDFILDDFTGNGVLDLAAVHAPESGGRGKLSLRLGRSNRTMTFFSDESEDIKVYDILESPVSVDVIRSAAGSKDLVLAYDGTDSLSFFRYNKNGLNADRFYNPIHFKVGGDGSSIIRSVFTTDHRPTGFLDAQNKAITTTGVTVAGNYYDGLVVGTDTPVRLSTRIERSPGTVRSIYATAGISLLYYDKQAKEGLTGSFRLLPGIIFASSVTYDVTETPHILLLADLNRDGTKDLITVDTFNSRFSVTFSQQDMGILLNGEADFYSFDGYGTGVAYGDFDEKLDNNPDGTRNKHNDLVISNYDRDTVSLFFNGGISSNTDLNDDYSFNHSGFPSKTIKVGKGPMGVAVADFDGDSHLDIVVANRVGNNICVLYNNKGNVAGAFEDCVFYNTGSSPVSVFAYDTQTSVESVQTATDIVVLNEDGETLTVFYNLSGSGRGFSAPFYYPVGNYFPSEQTYRNIQTELPENPFENLPIIMKSGNFGNITTKVKELTFSAYSSSPAAIETEVPWFNLVTANKHSVRLLKNIGDRKESQFRSAISSFTVNLPETYAEAEDGYGGLVYRGKLDDSLYPKGVIKSLTLSSDELIFNMTELSDLRSYSESEVLTDKFFYQSAKLYRVSTDSLSLNSTLIMTDTTNSSFELRHQELGGGFEALQWYNGTLYGLHSGVRGGIIPFSATGLPLTTGLRRKYREESAVFDWKTQFGADVRFNRPFGMCFDRSGDNLLIVDSGSGYIRVADLNGEDYATRTMRTGSDSSPNPVTGIVDITNQQHTYNYFALRTLHNPDGSVRRHEIQLIRPSDSPISVTTVALSAPLPVSYDEGFKIIQNRNYLYVGLRNRRMDGSPGQGTIFRIDTLTIPYKAQILQGVAGTDLSVDRLGGFTLNYDGTELYLFNERKLHRLSFDFDGFRAKKNEVLTGHEVDVSERIRLLQYPGEMDIDYPRDMVLNNDGDLLYFIDGATVRKYDFVEKSVSTVAGSILNAGIVDGDGTRARFIKPGYLLYVRRGNRDVLYVSDWEAHNIRRVEIDP
jgi:hypothetical protein